MSQLCDCGHQKYEHTGSGLPGACMMCRCDGYEPAPPGFLAEDLLPMTPEQVAWVRAQRKPR